MKSRRKVARQRKDGLPSCDRPLCVDGCQACVPGLNARRSTLLWKVRDDLGHQLEAFHAAPPAQGECMLYILSPLEELWCLVLHEHADGTFTIRVQFPGEQSYKYARVNIEALASA